MDNTIPQDTPQKQCIACSRKAGKPIFYPATREYFNFQKKSRDGFSPWCKQCYHQHYLDHKEERQQREALRKEEKQAYNQQYRAEHREELQVHNQQYRATHKEAIRQQRYQYRAQRREELRKKSHHFRLEHKEYYAQYNHRYYAQHREEILRSGRRYHAKHKEHRNQYSRQYHAEHREEAQAWNKRYRHTERGRLVHFAGHLRRRMHQMALPGILTPEQIREKLKQQHYRCYYAACGHAKFEKKNGQYIYHLEHTVPVSRTEYSPRHDMNFIVLACPSCNLKKRDKLPHEWHEGGRLM